MFKVHSKKAVMEYFTAEFQNISCLRFIDKSTEVQEIEILFQNISCLRFIIMKKLWKILIMNFKTFHV